MARSVRPAILALGVLAATALTSAHDIPNARIDRSVQVVLAPPHLSIEYEIGLGELTLIQDLRQLDDATGAADRLGLFERYAQLVGPLNARGFTVLVDRREVELQLVDFAITSEDHLRISFRFAAPIPPSGSLILQDNNYASSEGMSRLGLSVGAGVATRGDLPPRDVTLIPWRQTWQLSDADERATKRLLVEYSPRSKMMPPPAPERIAPARVHPPASSPSRLAELLDRTTEAGRAGWLLAAFLLGMIHAIQPGHGKTLVAAAALDGPRAVERGVGLGLLTATSHLVSVAALAGALWWLQVGAVPSVHLALVRGSGALIAAVGFFRLGCGLAEADRHHDHLGPRPDGRRTAPRFWVVGLAAGVVPCWDAVALVVLANSIGRLGWGLLLLVAFSGGLATVLVAVGWVAGRLRHRISATPLGRSSARILGLASGLVLALIGLGLVYL